eukprot:364564-Chlamydomonas_euryale.AAC.4
MFYRVQVDSEQDILKEVLVWVAAVYLLHLSHVLAARASHGGCQENWALTGCAINGQFRYGLNALMTGIGATRCGPAAAQWAVVRGGMPVKITE